MKSFSASKIKILGFLFNKSPDVILNEPPSLRGVLCTQPPPHRTPPEVSIKNYYMQVRLIYKSGMRINVADDKE